jgi:cytochrome b subunit of formate dehydrogenase
MLKKVKLLLILLPFIIAAGVYLAGSSETNLFASADWILVRAAIAGVVLGAARAVLRKRDRITDGEVTRHDAGSFISHWGTATGIFILIASGIMKGFFPGTSIARQMGDQIFATNLHFIGLAVTLLCGCFWLADYIVKQNYSELIPNLRDIIYGTLGKYLLRKKWPYDGKYLSSQKSAFLAFAVLGGIVLITGAIKTGNYVWHIPENVLNITTIIHDAGSILFILLLIVHILIVFILKEFPALKSWVTGKVPLDYAKKEYPLWIEQIKKQKEDEGKDK